MFVRCPPVARFDTTVVDGFPVPPMVIDQRFGRGMVIQEAFNDSWQRFYASAINENKLAPLAQPDLEVTKLEDGDLIEFTAEVDIRPEFDLPELSTLTATVDALDVPETLVDEQIAEIKSRLQRTNPVDNADIYFELFGDLVPLEQYAKALREKAGANL